MAINWSCLDKPANPASQHAEGEILKQLTDRAMAQSAANERALNQAKADEKKRLREEAQQTAVFMAREYARKGAKQ